MNNNLMIAQKAAQWSSRKKRQEAYIAGAKYMLAEMIERDAEIARLKTMYADLHAVSRELAGISDWQLDEEVRKRKYPNASNPNSVIVTARQEKNSKGRSERTIHINIQNLIEGGIIDRLSAKSLARSTKEHIETMLRNIGEDEGKTTGATIYAGRVTGKRWAALQDEALRARKINFTGQPPIRERDRQILEMLASAANSFWEKPPIFEGGKLNEGFIWSDLSKQPSYRGFTDDKSQSAPPPQGPPHPYDSIPTGLVTEALIAKIEKRFNRGNNDRFPGNDIDPTAWIAEGVEIGKNNKIGPYCIIGAPPEYRGKDGIQGRVIIGSGNIITGHVTIDSGADLGPDEPNSTIIGDSCYIMKGVHIGHNSIIADVVTISCHALIGGECLIELRANIGLGAIIHQQKNVPEGVMIGMGTIVTKKTELLPYKTYVGSPARLLGENSKHPNYTVYMADHPENK